VVKKVTAALVLVQFSCVFAHKKLQSYQIVYQLSHLQNYRPAAE
jgi:hypothetical protein